MILDGPRSREECFMSPMRERSDVNHPTGAIQTLQRVERTAHETEFAVVVVLDDHRPTSFGPREQRRLALERHRGAARKLVRRRDVDKSRISWNGIDLQSLIVDGHTDDVRAKASKEEPGVWITGLLDRDAGALGDEHAPDQVERLLRTLRDNHVSGICPHRS